MRACFLAVALLLLAALAAHGSPLLDSLGRRVITNLPDHNPDEALTKFALGRNWKPDTELLATHNEPGQAASVGTTLPHHDRITFSHSPSSPFQAPYWSKERANVPVYAQGSPSSHLQAVTVIPTDSVPSAATQGTNWMEAPPHVDLQFLSLLREAQQQSKIKLPSEIIYVRPPWLGDIYHRIIDSIKLGGKQFRHFEQEIPAEVVADIIARKKELISARSDMYALRFPHVKTEDGLQQTVEVLVRFHSTLKWPNGNVYSLLSVWSTAGGGKKLALLGMLNIGPAFFKRLVSTFPGVERMVAKPSMTSFSRERLEYELVPKH